MKKERAIKIAVLSAVFVLAIVLSGYFINRGNAGVTADMGLATLPTISFEVEGEEVNPLVGHKREMNMVAMRDTIGIYGTKGEIKIKLHYAGKNVKSLGYEVYSLDGKERLREESVSKIKDSMLLNVGNVLDKGQEGILKITLDCSGEKVHYYTRIVQEHDYHLKECLQYVKELHNNLIEKKNEEDVKVVMESNAQGDNTTLQHVTIHSDLRHVMWGDLKPEVIEKVSWDIKEVNQAYTAVQLRYRVSCAGDNNEKEHYQVKEFFKVSKGSERVYLLEYDRTMEEEFQTANVVLNSKGVVLGIAKGDLPHKVNGDGNIVAFIQAGELWNYNKEKDAFSLIFSFLDGEKEDERNRTDQHSIEILSMEENGNMTFSVCGYMNRGIHEGESGVAVYYYNLPQNSVREEAFIPSTESAVVIQKELNELAYYNQSEGLLYVMANGTLLQVESDTGNTKVLIEQLGKGQYVTSKDGHLLAYQKKSDKQVVTRVWDFTNHSQWTVPASQGEIVVPLGFVEDDFVYGVALESNKGFDVSGDPIWAMHRLEICNAKHEVIKTYDKQGVYILRVQIENNMITLKQGKKTGNTYMETESDYITSNEELNVQVEFQSYWTDLKETQYRFAFSKGIQDKKAKVLKPKQVLQEKMKLLSVKQDDSVNYYYVYGYGQAAGVFEDAGEAIALAEKLSGVVTSPKQNVVWEADNQVAWYHNFEISQFVAKTGESTLAACVRKVLSYERTDAEAVSQLGTKSAEQILSEQLGREAIRFHGCSVKNMRYLMDKGVAVIALKGSDSGYMLIGYDAKTITYIDPKDGGIYTASIEKMDEMLKTNGNSFIGYVK